MPPYGPQSEQPSGYWPNKPGSPASMFRGVHAGVPYAEPARRTVRRHPRVDPACGRVSQEAVGSADDEVARQADPDQRQPDPPGGLQLDDREADRQADPTVDDRVEEAVRGIGVLGGCRAAVADLAVEDVVE